MYVIIYNINILVFNLFINKLNITLSFLLLKKCVILIEVLVLRLVIIIFASLCFFFTFANARVCSLLSLLEIFPAIS